jgi:CheY-like chemotaxis protein
VLRQAVLDEKPFDLAILDMEMPDMDGLSLARAIKEEPSLTTVRLVLLTSLGRRGDATSARQAGFAGYLTKPVRKRQLETCLATVMGRQSKTASTDGSSLVTSHNLREIHKTAKARILVADDHQVNQKLAVLMLERLGHRVDVVANGQEAIDAIHRKTYDLILMDCQLPVMDGYDATRKIREAEGVTREALDERREVKENDSPHTLHLTSDHIPIIALTANAMREDREKCLEIGMDDYLSKPIKPEQLAKILSQWLPKQKSDIHNVECDTAHERCECQIFVLVTTGREFWPIALA